MSEAEANRDQPAGRSPRQEALTELVMRTFRLNGLFLEVAGHMAHPAGLTAARWQVLGAVLRQPLTVSGAAREMGLTRQSVQRLADALVTDGMAEFVDNPRHRRAKLLRPTAAGWDAIAVIRPLQHAWAARVTEHMSAEELRSAVGMMERVIARMEEDAPLAV